MKQPLDTPQTAISDVESEIKNRRIKVACFVTILLIITLNPSQLSFKPLKTKRAVTCRVELVESIPEGLEYNITYSSIYSAWKTLVEDAEESIDIASFYWSLKGADVIDDPSDWQGESIYNSLQEVGLDGKVKIRIAQSKPSRISPDIDTDELSRMQAAKVRSLDFDKLVGGGVLHTKLWVVDGKNFFLGSANMDWRSLTQVKEIGVVVRDCPALARDAEKIFKVYWRMGDVDAEVPKYWPVSIGTDINADSPLQVYYGSSDSVASVYLSSSPPQFVTAGRTGDIDSILRIINSSREYIHISVMEYMPLMMFSHPRKYWPVIDDALRSAAIDRRVSVKLLIGKWKHSPPEMEFFLKSLSALNKIFPHVDIQVKYFVVPTITPSQAAIPFARVNHNKFMVTDSAAYIGTSNWSGDYFVNTAGVGLIFENVPGHENELRRNLSSLFDRDWSSPYATSLVAEESKL